MISHCSIFKINIIVWELIRYNRVTYFLSEKSDGNFSSVFTERRTVGWSLCWRCGIHRDYWGLLHPRLHPGNWTEMSPQFWSRRGLSEVLHHVRPPGGIRAVLCVSWQRRFPAQLFCYWIWYIDILDIINSIQFSIYWNGIAKFYVLINFI